MRFEDEPMEASIRDSETGHEEGWFVEGQRVRGPVLRAMFRVRVWRGAERSRWRELLFTVTRIGEEVPDCVDPGCPPAGEASAVGRQDLHPGSAEHEALGSG
jgi:hypothetical protein